MASAPIVYYPIPLAGFIGYTRMLLPPIIVPIIYHPILLQPKHTDHPQETISSLLAYWPSTINSFSWESIRSNSTSCRKESWRKKGLHLLSLFCQTHTHTHTLAGLLCDMQTLQTVLAIANRLEDLLKSMA